MTQRVARVSTVFIYSKRLLLLPVFDGIYEFFCIAIKTWSIHVHSSVRFNHRLGQQVRHLITRQGHPNRTGTVRYVPHLGELRFWPISKKNILNLAMSLVLYCIPCEYKAACYALLRNTPVERVLQKSASASKNTTGSGHVPAFGNASDWPASRSLERGNIYR